MSKLSLRHGQLAFTAERSRRPSNDNFTYQGKKILYRTPNHWYLVAPKGSTYLPSIFWKMNLRLYIFCGQLLWLVSVLKGKALQGVPGYGRNLIIKALPAVEDYQSNIYEVYMEPYLYVSAFFYFESLQEILKAFKSFCYLLFTVCWTWVIDSFYLFSVWIFALHYYLSITTFIIRYCFFFYLKT